MDKYINATKICAGLKEMASVQPPLKQSTILGVVSTIENYPEADVISKKELQRLFKEIEEAVEDAEAEYGTIFGIKIAIGCVKNKYLGEE